MRGKALTLFAGFLILLVMAGTGCAHDPSKVQPLAKDQGVGGGDGGGGGY
jgi:hypothetical protein